MPLVRLGADLASADGCLVVEGDLVGQRAASIAEGIMFQCRGAKSSLVVDLSGVDEIDLTGVRALAAASRYAAGRGITLVVDRPSTVVHDALVRAGVAASFAIRH